MMLLLGLRIMQSNVKMFYRNVSNSLAENLRKTNQVTLSVCLSWMFVGGGAFPSLLHAYFSVEGRKFVPTLFTLLRIVSDAIDPAHKLR